MAQKFDSNVWEYPIDEFSPHDGNLKEILQRQIGSSWDFNKDEWNKACSTINHVLNTILKELRNQAQKHFEGLVIYEDFIRQASARQGLKINEPDEFDALFLFYIEGLRLKEVRLTDISDQYLPGQIRLRVEDVAQLERFPSLKRAGVFEMKSGTCLINTRVLQEQVFKSLMDKALHELTLRCGNSSENLTINRGSRPPTMDMTIISSDGKSVNADFVPALILSQESIYVPINASSLVPITFQRYGLMKWINKKNTIIDEEDKNFIWRSCSSSYERCMFDLCDGNKERSYIRTACRVMKALVKQLRTRPNQAAVLLSSYHLKTIAMYCILLLTVPSKLTSHSAPLNGVREALGYFLTFLELVLEKECLPDFFLGNEYLDKIFPGSYFSKIRIKYNLFDKEDPAKVQAAKYGLPEMKTVLAECFEVRNLNPRVVTFFREKTLSV
ncbi:cyclic GMP-AMP synthase-like receptor 1 [Crassostrea virginica]